MTMHPIQFELGLGPLSERQRGVANNVPQGLPRLFRRGEGFPFVVVAQDADVHEPADGQSFVAEEVGGDEHCCDLWGVSGELE